MPADDPIPSFLELQKRPASRRRTSTQPLRTEQMALGLSAAPAAAPVKTLYAPILLEPEARPEPPPAPVARATLYTVRQLIADVKGQLESAYRGILNVEGEVSNCRPAASGHLYFTLKDGDAQLPVVMFRSRAQLMSFKLKDGLAVEVRGRISVYESRGQLQLIAETMRPRGAGALQIAFEQLRDRLKLEGLFDAERKRPLPPFPHCIGIITSPRGAALHDIIHVVRRRHARLNLLIYPAVMQGAQCAASVSAGLAWFNRNPQRVDLILIARGGGSLEDLAGFNAESLARAIVASDLPVVSAIGHEIDHSIADFVADLRAPTPSAAAELITAAQHRIEERVAALARRVHRAGQYHLLAARQRLARLSAQYVLARLRDAVSLRGQRVDDLHRRLLTAETRLQRMRGTRLQLLQARLDRQNPAVRLALTQRRLQALEQRLRQLPSALLLRRRGRIERAGDRLQALSPLAVLGRGYAIVYLENAAGRSILRDADAAPAGSTIQARLGRGSLRAIVTAKENTP